MPEAAGLAAIDIVFADRDWIGDDLRRVLAMPMSQEDQAALTATYLKWDRSETNSLGLTRADKGIQDFRDRQRALAEDAACAMLCGRRRTRTEIRSEVADLQIDPLAVEILSTTGLDVAAWCLIESVPLGFTVDTRGGAIASGMVFYSGDDAHVRIGLADGITLAFGVRRTITLQRNAVRLPETAMGGLTGSPLSAIVAHPVLDVRDLAMISITEEPQGIVLDLGPTDFRPWRELS